MKIIIITIVISTLIGCAFKDEKGNNNLLKTDTLTKKNNSLERNIINKNDSQKRLKEFYKLFCQESNNDLYEKYISNRIIKKIDSLEGDLDYNPFIRSQDWDNKSVLKSLKIVPLKKIDEFKVSFLLFNNLDEKRELHIVMQNENNKGYVIYRILDDDFFK